MNTRAKIGKLLSIQGTGDTAQSCPVCQSNIYRHIITLNWDKIDVCNCGWTSRQNFTLESQQIQIKPETEDYHERTTTIQTR